MKPMTLRTLSYMSLAVLAGCVQPNAPESTAYRQRIFAEHLDGPQAVAPISDDTVLVAERSGRVLFVRSGTRVNLGNVSVRDAPILFVNEDGYIQGLKDLVAVPGQSQTFLWCMTTADGPRIRWTVGRLHLVPDGIRSPSMTNAVIWQSEPQAWRLGGMSPFSGCRMAFSGDDVIVAMGANDRHTGSGRIMRISMTNRHTPLLVSTGHRNPGGIVIKDGITWEVEFGPAGGDELNMIVPGADYGWPFVSRGEPQEDGEPQGTGSTKVFLESRAGSVDPVVSWTPSINPSSLTAWRGKLYMGTLTGDVTELDIDGSKVSAQRQFLHLGDRIRDVRASRDGRSLWVLTDGPDAQLLLVSPSQRSGESDPGRP